MGVACFIFGRRIVYRIFEGLALRRYRKIFEKVIPEQFSLNLHNIFYFIIHIDQERWNGTYEPVRLPPRSPDQIWFFCWDFMKNKNCQHVAYLCGTNDLTLWSIILFNAIRRKTKTCDENSASAIFKFLKFSTLLRKPQSSIKLINISRKINWFFNGIYNNSQYTKKNKSVK